MNKTTYSHRDAILHMLSNTQDKARRENQWGARHVDAWHAAENNVSTMGPTGERLARIGFERSLVSMIRGWAVYADTHLAQYGSSIGDDGVLGPEWAAIGRAMLGLLNGELGRLDGGTLDALIRNGLRAEGFDDE